MPELSDQFLYLLVLILLWTLPWKGVALWMAARRSHTWWFILLLVVNSLALIEIVYIFLVAKQYTVESDGGDGESNLGAEVEK